MSHLTGSSLPEAELEPMPSAERPAEPEAEQPGLGLLRSAVANRSREEAGARPQTGTRAPSQATRQTPRALPEVPAAPRRGGIARDAVAGLSSAMSNVPGGLASGLLVGVNPIFGLYASIVGPIAGGAFASSKLMVITTTSAAALAAGQALGGLAGDARADALFVMVLLIGGLSCSLETCDWAD